ncbi:hypothetical protein EG328_004299 [Venturia inaequalis]|uniref:Uncharacterized protein n=1 Tax=Venturia inaequalis TaxID=5025 RepID=A0A8H3YVP1_VENIN|nr:hypothetical protein EG328_004299 [Venturia inaequalis]
MKFLPIVSLILSATTCAHADVADVQGFPLLSIFKTIKNLPTRSVRCGGTLPRNEVFTAHQISLAAKAALTHLLKGTQVDLTKAKGTRNFYPKPYGYKDPLVRFPSALCGRDDQLSEFPITRGLYAGASTKDLAHRIVIKQIGRKAIYCGLITHEGAPEVSGLVAPYVNCDG